VVFFFFLHEQNIESTVTLKFFQDIADKR